MKSNDALAAMLAAGVFVLPIAAQAEAPAAFKVNEISNFRGMRHSALVKKMDDAESGAIALAPIDIVATGGGIHAVVDYVGKSSGS